MSGALAVCLNFELRLGGRGLGTGQGQAQEGGAPTFVLGDYVLAFVDLGQGWLGKFQEYGYWKAWCVVGLRLLPRYLAAIDQQLAVLTLTPSLSPSAFVVWHAVHLFSRHRSQIRAKTQAAPAACLHSS